LFINNNVLSNEIPNLEKKRGRLWNIETIKEIRHSGSCGTGTAYRFRTAGFPGF
jgi:hypothetical protein